VHGATREYRLYTPRAATGAARLPLLILLHGGGQTAEQVENMSRMDETAETKGFLVAYPNGTRGRLGGATWNAGDCCGVAMVRNVDDVAFISTLISALIAERNADANRVYVTGISNGAMMTYRAGCELSAKVAAIAPVAGTLMADCKPSRPVPAIIFHGTADTAVPINGGWNPRSGARRPFPPLAKVLQEWLEMGRCVAPPEVEYRNGAATCKDYRQCGAGAEVAVCLIEGGGHSWPGGKPFMPVVLGLPSHDISADDAMWKFFERHPMRP